jgi:hypothetical protein
MAYVPSYVDDDDDEGKKTAQAITTDAATPAAEPATATSTAAATQSPLTEKGYVGIGEYFEANKEQAQELAEKVKTPIDEQIEEAKATQSQYNKDWASSYAKAADTAQKSQAQSQTQLNQDWQNQLNEAYYLWQKTPSTIAPSDSGSIYGSGTSKANSLREEREKAYRDLLANAPTAALETVSAPTYTPDTSQAQAVESTIEGLGTQEGRQAVLSDIGKAGYSAGQRQFDAALLGTSNIPGKLKEQYSGIVEALMNPTAPGLTYTPRATAATSAASANEAARKYFLQKLAEEGYENPEEIAAQFAKF